MLHSTHRAPSTIITFFMLLLAPGLAFAEVSDKEPTLGLIWAVGAFSALLCFMGARLQRWLAPVVGALPLLWFVSLLMEIHASDVAPASDGFRAKTTRNAGVPITSHSSCYSNKSACVPVRTKTIKPCFTLSSSL